MLFFCYTQGQKCSKGFELTGFPSADIEAPLIYQCWVLEGKDLYNLIPVHCILRLVAVLSLSCPTLCDFMNYSTPGFPILHYLPQFTSLASQLVRICLKYKRPGFNPWVGKILWRREWLVTSVFSPGELHGKRSLAGYTVHGVAKESNTTE